MEPWPLLLVCALAVSATPEGRRLITKCCALDEHLNGKACVPLDAAAQNASVASEPQEVSVDELRRDHYDFPPWMDPKTLLDDANASDSFLENQPGHLRIRFGAMPQCSKANMTGFYSDRPRYRLYLNGSLAFNISHSETGAMFSPEEFCVDRHKDKFVFLLCPCNKTLCISKCCPRGQAFFLPDVACKKSQKIWTPTFISNDEPEEKPLNVSHHVKFDNALPCGEGFSKRLLNHEAPHKKFRILPSGSVAIADIGVFPNYHYCADWTFIEGSDQPVENVYYCLEELGIGGESVFYGVMYIVGGLFLLLTLVVYAVVPELRRSHHAKALMCHVATLLVANVALAFSRLQSSLPASQCYTVAFLVQFSVLASTFWLNVLCIDISSAFKDMLPASGTFKKRKFVFYSLYGWLSPAFITILTLVLDTVEHLPKHVIKPGIIGGKVCWFQDFWASCAYYYGPMVALLLLNAALCGYVLWRIAATRLQADRARAARNVQCSKDRVAVPLRLLIVMGVTWLLEVTSWAAGGAREIWYATDAINMLRGLFVFLACCCKRDVLDHLRKQLRGRLCGWCVGDASAAGELKALGTGDRRTSQIPSSVSSNATDTSQLGPRDARSPSDGSVVGQYASLDAR